MNGQHQDGSQAIRESVQRVVPPGRLSAEVIRDWRRRTVKALAAAGNFSSPQIATIIGTPERTVRRDLRTVSEPPQLTDPADPPPASTRSSPRLPKLSAQEVMRIRKCYAHDNDPAVISFLDSLDAAERATTS